MRFLRCLLVLALLPLYEFPSPSATVLRPIASVASTQNLFPTQTLAAQLALFPRKNRLNEKSNLRTLKTLSRPMRLASRQAFAPIEMLLFFTVALVGIAFWVGIANANIILLIFSSVYILWRFLPRVIAYLLKESLPAPAKKQIKEYQNLQKLFYGEALSGPWLEIKSTQPTQAKIIPMEVPSLTGSNLLIEPKEPPPIYMVSLPDGRFVYVLANEEPASDPLQERFLRRYVDPSQLTLFIGPSVDASVQEAWPRVIFYGQRDWKTVYLHLLQKTDWHYLKTRLLGGYLYLLVLRLAPLENPWGKIEVSDENIANFKSSVYLQAMEDLGLTENDKPSLEKAWNYIADLSLSDLHREIIFVMRALQNAQNQERVDQLRTGLGLGFPVVIHASFSELLAFAPKTSKAVKVGEKAFEEEPQEAESVTEISQIFNAPKDVRWGAIFQRIDIPAMGNVASPPERTWPLAKRYISISLFLLIMNLGLKDVSSMWTYVFGPALTIVFFLMFHAVVLEELLPRDILLYRVVLLLQWKDLNAGKTPRTMPNLKHSVFLRAVLRQVFHKNVEGIRIALAHLEKELDGARLSWKVLPSVAAKPLLSMISQERLASLFREINESKPWYDTLLDAALHVVAFVAEYALPISYGIFANLLLGFVAERLLPLFILHHVPVHRLISIGVFAWVSYRQNLLGALFVQAVYDGLHERLHALPGWGYVTLGVLAFFSLVFENRFGEAHQKSSLVAA